MTVICHSSLDIRHFPFPSRLLLVLDPAGQRERVDDRDGSGGQEAPGGPLGRSEDPLRSHRVFFVVEGVHGEQ